MQIGARRRRAGSGPPKFVTGSPLRHVLVMTGTGAIGLMAIFVSDLATILFLSWQGDQAVVAAVGYAGSVVFLTIAMGLGLSIAAAALVAPARGAGRRGQILRWAARARAAQPSPTQHSPGHLVARLARN